MRKEFLSKLLKLDEGLDGIVICLDGVEMSSWMLLDEVEVVKVLSEEMRSNVKEFEKLGVLSEFSDCIKCWIEMCELVDMCCKCDEKLMKCKCGK